MLNIVGCVLKKAVEKMLTSTVKIVAPLYVIPARHHTVNLKNYITIKLLQRKAG